MHWRAIRQRFETDSWYASRLTPDLQARRREIDPELNAIDEKFPDWKSKIRSLAWERGHALERERDRIELELIRRKGEEPAETQHAPIQESLTSLAETRGFVTDALKDTATWLSNRPCSQVAVNVHSIQQNLNNLARIVERRLERRSLVADDKEWSENVVKACSSLERAKRIHGSIVGRVLPELAERLPDELPNSQVRRETAEGNLPTEFSGGTTGLSHSATPTRVLAEAPTGFPIELWPQANLIIFDSTREFRDQTQALPFCKSIIAKITPLLCSAVENGNLKVNDVDRMVGKLIHDLAVYNSNYDRDGWKLETEVMNSDEMHNLVRKLAELTPRAFGPHAPRTLKPERKENLPLVQPLNSPLAAQPALSDVSDRRSLVNKYIEEVGRVTGKRITRKDIWSKAGYRSRTEFERWERRDPKNPNKSANRAFQRILNEKPHLR